MYISLFKLNELTSIQSDSHWIKFLRDKKQPEEKRIEQKWAAAGVQLGAGVGGVALPFPKFVNVAIGNVVLPLRWPQRRHQPQRPQRVDQKPAPLDATDAHHVPAKHQIEYVKPIPQNLINSTLIELFSKLNWIID